MVEKMIPFLVIGFVLIIFGFNIWRLEAHYRKIESFEGLTAQEKRALRWQMWAIIPSATIGLVGVLLFFGSVIPWTFLQFFAFIAVINAIAFVYIGLSSIINRVSILVPKGSGMELSKGSSAIFAGSFTLAIVAIMTLFIIFFSFNLN